MINKRWFLGTLVIARWSIERLGEHCILFACASMSNTGRLVKHMLPAVTKLIAAMVRNWNASYIILSGDSVLTRNLQSRSSAKKDEAWIRNKQTTHLFYLRDPVLKSVLHP